MTDDCQVETTTDTPEATEATSPPTATGYHPLLSVWDGSNAELIEQMLDF